MGTQQTFLWRHVCHPKTGAALPVQPECAVVLPAVTMTLTKTELEKDQSGKIRREKRSMATCKTIPIPLLLPLNGLLFLSGLTDIPET